MFISGSKDARGYQQWKEVDRFVKKGSKAIYILVPKIAKTVDSETGEEETILKGFMCRPVFRVEDTEGEPLDYEQNELPYLPLLERAIRNFDQDHSWKFPLLGVLFVSQEGNCPCYG